MALHDFKKNACWKQEAIKHFCGLGFAECNAEWKTALGKWDWRNKFIWDIGSKISLSHNQFMQSSCQVKTRTTTCYSAGALCVDPCQLHLNRCCFFLFLRVSFNRTLSHNTLLCPALCNQPSCSPSVHSFFVGANWWPHQHLSPLPPFPTNVISSVVSLSSKSWNVNTFQIFYVIYYTTCYGHRGSTKS